MSLFKVRDFWSFDLDNLKRQAGDRPTPSNPDLLSPFDDKTLSHADFIISIGRFSSVGDQDVFVCGDLRGNVYLIQVPDTDQERLLKRVSSDEENADRASSSNRQQSASSNIGERQLLAATSLYTSLVDLKCGYFTSALKQSIAVLSADKLMILNVKKRQLDLITGPGLDSKGNAGSSKTASSLDESVLSHEFEEYIRLDLLNSEFAHGVVVLNSHADSSLLNEGKHSAKETDLDAISMSSKSSKRDLESRGLHQMSKQVVQQLQLPQRDKIVIKYTNQFVFTLVDGKKVLGHYCVSSQPTTAMDKADTSMKGPDDSKLGNKAQYFGSMPMTHMMCGPGSSQSSLVISLSNYYIYCLPIDKLISLARQKIVNRVALNLLGASSGSSMEADRSTMKAPSAIKADGQLQDVNSLIEINLDAISEWQHEMPGLPLQLQGLQRKARLTQPAKRGDRLLVGQLLAMCRYSLELFASSGEHLWHQRFEAPLICLHVYTIESTAEKSSQASGATGATGASESIPKQPPSEAFREDKFVLEDQIVSLVCSASLSDDRSNLMILKDEQMSWSALLNSNPLQLLRLNLNRISGLIATIDVKSGQLVASYLGSNTSDPTCDGIDGLEMKSSGAEADQVVELERLDESLDSEDTKKINPEDDQRERLLVTNQVEMGSSDGIVNVCTSIRLSPSSSSVVQNIVITFEFDSLFKFDLIESSATSPSVNIPAQGVAEVKVGNCWPDRKEPIKIRACFSLISTSSTKLVGVAAMNELNNSELDEFSENSTKLLPKSLQVRQFLVYNETHTGLLHQRQSFLLPIGVVAQMIHLDYSSGQGQDLGDVLNNLNGYKWTTDSLPTHSYCDLFIGLNFDFITLLQDFIEADLICRGRMPGRNQQGKEGRSHSNSVEMKLETMESINMLAQSLDCRIRYMSPSPSEMARQTSEEPVQPVMISFAFLLRYGYPNLFETVITNGNEVETEDDKTVWVHICDLSASNGSSIPKDFIALHMKGWMNFLTGVQCSANEQTVENTSGQTNISKALISIESQHPMVTVFVLDHLIQRIAGLQTGCNRTNTILVQSSSEFDIYNGFVERKLNPATSYLAISSALHRALVSTLSAHENEYKSKLKQLQLDLVKESNKYQIATENTLSFSKKLPSLPNNLNTQVNNLMTQAKESQLKIMNILERLDQFKKLDFKMTKLPAASEIKLEFAKNSKLTPWIGFEPAFD